MQKDDEALHQSGMSWSVSEKLLTLESHAIFSLNFASLYILRLSLVYIIKLNNNLKKTGTLSL